MPSVAELSAPYANFMLAPRPGPDTCEVCFNFTRGFSRCYGCANNPQHLAAVAPISYSVATEQLHRALMVYKRLEGEVARRTTFELAAVLWRYLALHEGCVAGAAGVDQFQLVTTVPGRKEQHPLQTIVGELVGATRDRHRPLLRRGSLGAERAFDAGKFEPLEQLDGQPVLLIDDTWTTGASAQSAAATLKAAGAGPVAAVVLGRHVNRDWHENDARLRAIPLPFDWERCALRG